MTKCIAMIVMTLVTPKAAAKLNLCSANQPLITTWILTFKGREKIYIEIVTEKIAKSLAPIIVIMIISHAANGTVPYDRKLRLYEQRSLTEGEGSVRLTSLC